MSVKQRALKHNPGGCQDWCTTIDVFGGDYTIIPDCSSGCTWFSDSLNRPGDTEADLIAKGWVEVSGAGGNWSINSDGYLTNDTADAWLNANCPSPAGRGGAPPKYTNGIDIWEPSSLMKVFCGSSSSGDQLRVGIASYSIGVSPSVYAQLEVDATSGSLSLWGLGGQLGESVSVPGATLDDLHQLTLCLDLCNNEDEDEGYKPDQWCSGSIYVARVDCADGTSHVITHLESVVFGQRAPIIYGFFSLGVGDLTGTPFFQTASAQLIKNFWTLRYIQGFDAVCPTCHGLIPVAKVLLWNANNSSGADGLIRVQSFYESFGITAHLSSEWSGNINEYGLIIWLLAESDPVWWSSIADGSWTGRFHISAEWYGWPESRDYVNSKTSLHGITVASNNSEDPLSCYAVASPSAHQLTADMSNLKHSDTASVSGGTTLFTSALLSAPMMQQNKSGNIDWVVSGDSSHLDDHCPLAEDDENKVFLWNLATKPLP